jgi:hypothetical protein
VLVVGAGVGAGLDVDELVLVVGAGDELVLDGASKRASVSQSWRIG